jgi:hypothetical protein
VANRAAPTLPPICRKQLPALVAAPRSAAFTEFRTARISTGSTNPTPRPRMADQTPKTWREVSSSSLESSHMPSAESAQPRTGKIL